MLGKVKFSTVNGIQSIVQDDRTKENEKGGREIGRHSWISRYLSCLIVSYMFYYVCIVVLDHLLFHNKS